MPPRTGVLLSAHGTVQALDELPGFLARIRRGRPTPPALLDEVRRRYAEIGGSPLLAITREQARLLGERVGLPTFVGMRLWDPSLEAAVAEARAQGVERLVSLPLAPQSVLVYHEAVREALGGQGPSLVEVPAWGDEPALLGAFSASIDEGLAVFPDGYRSRVPVVLSAHSLPSRVIAAGDAYEAQFRAMASALIARRAEPSRPFRVAFQSQGMDGGEWLGPDLAGTFAALAAEGHREVLVAAIGFVSDHIETLYDLDIDAPRLGQLAGLTRVARAPSLNARPAFIDALEAITRRALAAS
jgi:protoporphyrin/coproporphyrin ferrochelatase